MKGDIQRVLQLFPVRTAPFFAAGMLACAMGGLPSLVLLLVAAIVAGVVYLIYRKGFVSVAALVAGMAFMVCYIAFAVQPLKALDGTTQTLDCSVSERYDNGGYVSYKCRTGIDGIRTSIYVYNAPELDIGDRFTADIALSEIGTASKAMVREVLLSGTVRQVISVDEADFSISRTLAEFRQRLSAEISLRVEDDYEALANGLLFGETSEFSLKLTHAAKISGVMHFTAVSGSHFVIIMSVILEIFGKHKRMRAIASVVCIPLAVLFFGADPSVLRSGIMLFLCNCGPLLSRRSETLNSLCVSVVIMTVTAPYIILDAGFQMSVMGVFGVSVVGSAINCWMNSKLHLPRLLKGACDLLVISVCAVVCIAPISVPLFGGVSLVGTFATLVLTPPFTVALAFGVLYALSGLELLIIPIALSVEACYKVIMLFGSDSRLWLALEYDGAVFLTLITAVLLIVMVVCSDDYSQLGVSVLCLLMSATVLLAAISATSRRKIVFVSDGKNGAAVMCVKDEAVILVCGDTDGMQGVLADHLLRNGIHYVRQTYVTDISYRGAIAYAELNELYPTDIITVSEDHWGLAARCSGSEIIERRLSYLMFDGLSIAAAKSGDTECDADIVIYTSYKMSEPLYGAKLLPLYASSRQNILPAGGINIYDNDFELIMEK